MGQDRKGRDRVPPQGPHRRLRPGVVFHTGPHCVRYADDERIIALPVDRLWSGNEA